MKLSKIWENIVFVAELAIDYKKTAVAIVLVLLICGYTAVTRVPALLSCTYSAVVDQSVPSEQWRHNMWNNNCQYYNGTRWIPLEKVMDVGAGESSELESN